MQVHLLRHGIAEDERPGLPDADRALTTEGRRKLRQVLQSASQAGVEPSLILSSPYKRAIQSAEMARDALAYKGEILRTKTLTPGASVEQVWEEIRVHRQETSIILAGHNPLFENLAGYLLGCRNFRMDFKKGAMLRVDIEGFGIEPRGVLRWYLTAKLSSSLD
jgi:phosphohistidine phosphatase